MIHAIKTFQLLSIILWSIWPIIALACICTYDSSQNSCKKTPLVSYVTEVYQDDVLYPWGIVTPSAGVLFSVSILFLAVQIDSCVDKLKPIRAVYTLRFALVLLAISTTLHVHSPSSLVGNLAHIAFATIYGTVLGLNVILICLIQHHDERCTAFLNIKQRCAIVCYTVLSLLILSQATSLFLHPLWLWSWIFVEYTGHLLGCLVIGFYVKSLYSMSCFASNLNRETTAPEL